MRKPEKLRLAERVVAKVNKADRMLALVWIVQSYALIELHDWASMLANKRATYEDLVAIYAPGITPEQVLADLRVAHR
jgi:hypothetical protein